MTKKTMRKQYNMLPFANKEEVVENPHKFQATEGMASYLPQLIQFFSTST